MIVYYMKLSFRVSRGTGPSHAGRQKCSAAARAPLSAKWRKRCRASTRPFSTSDHGNRSSAGDWLRLTLQLAVAGACPVHIER